MGLVMPGGIPPRRVPPPVDLTQRRPPPTRRLPVITPPSTGPVTINQVRVSRGLSRMDGLDIPANQADQAEFKSLNKRDQRAVQVQDSVLRRMSTKAKEQEAAARKARTKALKIQAKQEAIAAKLQRYAGEGGTYNIAGALASGAVRASDLRIFGFGPAQVRQATENATQLRLERRKISAAVMGDIAARDTQAKALTALKGNTKDGRVDISAALRRHIPENTIRQAGFSQKDIDNARTRNTALKDLTSYRRGDQVNLSEALKGGAQDKTLTDAGFTPKAIRDAKVANVITQRLEAFKMPNGTYDLASATRSGLSSDLIERAGFSRSDIDLAKTLDGIRGAMTKVPAALKFTGDVAKMVVPGVWVVDWNKMSNTDRALNIGLDALMLIPFAGLAAKGARGVFRASLVAAGAPSRAGTRIATQLARGLAKGSRADIFTSAQEIRKLGLMSTKLNQRLKLLSKQSNHALNQLANRAVGGGAILQESAVVRRAVIKARALKPSVLRKAQTAKRDALRASKAEKIESKRRFAGDSNRMRLEIERLGKKRSGLKGNQLKELNAEIRQLRADMKTTRTPRTTRTTIKSRQLKLSRQALEATPTETARRRTTAVALTAFFGQKKVLESFARFASKAGGEAARGAGGTVAVLTKPVKPLAGVGRKLATVKAPHRIRALKAQRLKLAQARRQRLLAGTKPKPRLRKTKSRTKVKETAAQKKTRVRSKAPSGPRRVVRAIPIPKTSPGGTQAQGKGTPRPISVPTATPLRKAAQQLDPAVTPPTPLSREIQRITTQAEDFQKPGSGPTPTPRVFDLGKPDPGPQPTPDPTPDPDPIRIKTPPKDDDGTGTKPTTPKPTKPRATEEFKGTKGRFRIRLPDGSTHEVKKNPEGLYPRVFRFVMGIAVHTIDLDTGKRFVRRAAPAQIGKTPGETFEILRFDNTPPPARWFQQGIVAIRTTPHDLTFVRRRRNGMSKGRKF